MDFQLLPKEEAVKTLAEIAGDDLSMVIDVCEDICFEDKQTGYKWANLGEIILKQGVEDPKTAIRLGAYEWHTPTKLSLDQYIEEAVSFDESPKKDDFINRVKKDFHQGFQDIIRRLLLLLPTFDPDAVCRMPLKRATTIVPDTSAVHQGALDFVARFLSPMARIKIPAIVQMEIENQMHNYMSGIRSKKVSSGTRDNLRSRALGRHLLSQGGQRTLLRLELHSDVEMDRGELGADPVRGIIQPSSDREDRVLDLTDAVRSFADRLIVETAHLHRSRVRPDHPLVLLTSDQGMARMVMAEGMDVFFFQSRSTPDPAGKILTGTNFHPFESKLYTVPLTEVLWELAVSFGGVRVTNPKSNSYLELWALGGPEQLTWHPLHAKDDLIWGHYQPVPKAPKRAISEVEPSKTTRTRFAPKGYTFTPSRMLDLIGSLAGLDSLTYSEIRDILSVRSSATSQRYVRFLQSGQLVTEVDDHIEPTDDLRKLWQAISELDIPSIHELLMAVPSYSNFCSAVYKARQLDADSEEIPIGKKALPEYIAIGEMAGAILSIPGKGLVATDNAPDVSNFAECAVECYNEISHRTDEWILTGAWLECLVLRFAIHPVRAREFLRESKDKGILGFFLEGSTPDNRFQEHSMIELRLVQGRPTLRKIYLYRGDFISPGTAGVRIKIRMGKSNAA